MSVIDVRQHKNLLLRRQRSVKAKQLRSACETIKRELLPCQGQIVVCRGFSFYILKCDPQNEGE